MVCNVCAAMHDQKLCYLGSTQTAEVCLKHGHNGTQSLCIDATVHQTAEVSIIVIATVIASAVCEVECTGCPQEVAASILQVAVYFVEVKR